MSELVDPSMIEKIVGIKRHPTFHYGRAVSAQKTVYILHSQKCFDSGISLMACEYSIAMDEGINHPKVARLWSVSQDIPVPLDIKDGLLVPHVESSCNCCSDPGCCQCGH